MKRNPKIKVKLPLKKYRENVKKDQCSDTIPKFRRFKQKNSVRNLTVQYFLAKFLVLKKAVTSKSKRKHARLQQKKGNKAKTRFIFKI